MALGFKDFKVKSENQFRVPGNVLNPMYLGKSHGCFHLVFELFYHEVFKGFSRIWLYVLHASMEHLQIEMVSSLDSSWSDPFRW